MGLRTLLECYVHLSFLLKKDDAELWKMYRTHGSGQAKLAFLHLEELDETRSFVSREALEELANEDTWQEFLPINIGHWATANLRDLAEKAGVKDDYDRFYAWTSG